MLSGMCFAVYIWLTSRHRALFFTSRPSRYYSLGVRSDFHLDSHSMDHTLAVWALGGSPEAVEEVYRSHDYTERVRPSPQPITDANFFAHLGDAKYVHVAPYPFKS